MEKGLIHLYTGDGKGKTTAAIGQGVRTAGGGYRVYMVQFLKSGHTGELEALHKLHPNFKVFRSEKPRGFVWTLNENEIDELKKEIKDAFEFARTAMANKECDMLILDEIMGAVGNKLVTVEELVNFLKSKPQDIELILTGRNAPAEVVEIADYVSEIKCVKHPYQKGIAARQGIEF